MPINNGNSSLAQTTQANDDKKKVEEHTPKFVAKPLTAQTTQTSWVEKKVDGKEFIKHDVFKHNAFQVKGTIDLNRIYCENIFYKNPSSKEVRRYLPYKPKYQPKIVYQREKSLIEYLTAAEYANISLDESLYILGLDQVDFNIMVNKLVVKGEKMSFWYKKTTMTESDVVGFTEEVRNAIAAYTVEVNRPGYPKHSPYYIVNRVLREQNVEEIRKAGAYILYLLSGLRKIKLYEGENGAFELYRGVPAEFVHPESYYPGMVFTWSQFTSTSIKKEVTLKFTQCEHGVVFVIRGRGKCIGGYRIRSLSQFLKEDGKKNQIQILIQSHIFLCSLFFTYFLCVFCRSFA